MRVARVCLDFFTALMIAAIASNSAATECTDEAELAEFLNPEACLTPGIELPQSAGASQRCVVATFVSIDWKTSRHNSDAPVLKNIK